MPSTGATSDAFVALNYAEMEFTPLNAALEGDGPYRGHDEIRKWWRSLYIVDSETEALEAAGLREQQPSIHTRPSRHAASQ